MCYTGERILRGRNVSTAEKGSTVGIKSVTLVLEVNDCLDRVTAMLFIAVGFLGNKLSPSPSLSWYLGRDGSCRLQSDLKSVVACQSHNDCRYHRYCVCVICW